MDIYGRELRELPPADAFVAGYFGYEPPGENDGAPVEEFKLPQLSEL